MDRQAAIDLILDHYEHPRHYGPMDDVTITHQGTTAGCGDVVVLHLKLNGNDRIADIRFEGKGCTISQAAASILTEMVAGRPLGEAMALTHETMIEAMGEEIVRQRLACATLALDVLKAAGELHRKGA